MMRSFTSNREEVYFWICLCVLSDISLSSALMPVLFIVIGATLRLSRRYKKIDIYLNTFAGCKIPVDVCTFLIRSALRRHLKRGTYVIQHGCENVQRC